MSLYSPDNPNEVRGMSNTLTTSPSIVNHVDHYGSDSVQVPSVHPEISTFSDCSVMRTVSAPPVTAQYTYLDPSLSRRNGVIPVQHAGLSPYSTDGTATYTDMNCGQLNGSPYLNHATSHLHHPAHHHHHHIHARPPHIAGRQPIHGVTSINNSSSGNHPSFKWMQVKRNVPKASE